LARKESHADIMVEFARLVSSFDAGSETLPKLADALVEHAGARAVVVVAIGESGVAFAELRGVEHPPPGLEIDVDDISSHLGGQILAAYGHPFTHAETRHLVTEGDLFGAVVTLFHDKKENPTHARLADGLVDLAALALGNKAYVARLERSHADLRQSQELLARTEKVRALGQMAAGVSHDLMNILHPLGLYLQLVGRAVERGEKAEAQESAKEMERVLTRGMETIQRLRDYSRQNPEPKTETADLNALLREAAALAKPRLASAKSSARIVEKLGTPPSVRAVAGDLLSAFVNLIVNAIDVFVGRSGTITLESGAADGGAWVAIRDDGPGMSPDLQRRVFEPFFTTKGTEGTGLGLAMVHACMERHGGTVTLVSELGHGTTFRLWFRGETSAPPTSTRQ
jgi:signal transduction histidine kinase